MNTGHGRRIRGGTRSPNGRVQRASHLMGLGLSIMVFAFGGPVHAQSADVVPSARDGCSSTFPADVEILSMLQNQLVDRPGVAMVVGVVDDCGARAIGQGPVGQGLADGKTVFEIGSITKIFTGLLLADMAERGQVALDDPIADYLPADIQMQTPASTVTLINLATHSSGLPRLPDNMPVANPRNPYADYTPEMMLDFLGGYEPAQGASGRFVYSNLGPGLLGHLLGRHAGTSYESLVRMRITEPLGMMDTSFEAAEGKVMATPHDAAFNPTEAWSFDGLAGAGALRSNADDMLIFLSAHLGLISTQLNSALAATRTVQAAGPDAHTRMAIGWFVLETPSGSLFLHDGATGGSASVIMMDPGRRRGVVVLMNAAAASIPTHVALRLLDARRPAQPAA